MKVIRILLPLVVVSCIVSVLNLEAQRGMPPGQSQAGGAPSAKPPTPTTPPTPKTPKTPPTTASQHLAAQPKLAATLQPLLPAGTDLQAAATGFKNLGEFVAAVHVSNNLDIPFDQLKTQLTGPTPKSLGAAIKTLKPSADAAAEVKKAEAQAKKDQAGKGL
jgi:hypothetical protein